MSNPLIAIGLDSADYRLLESWMDKGELPVLRALRDRGTYGRLQGAESFSAEAPWTNFFTGVFPEKSGFYGTFLYDPATYSVKEGEQPSYGFDKYRSFFALHGRKVAIFDLPQCRLADGINGIQVMAWGAHAPHSPPGSIPEGLLKEIEEKYGKHPGLLSDHNDWWRSDLYETFKKKLFTGIERRGNICHDLLKKGPWDLFLTVFGETHAIGHDYYFTSRSDHPLAKFRDKIGVREDAVLAVYRKIDEAIGKILSAAPENARIVVFSPLGMRANQNDLPTMVFLPEMFYRKHFSGKGLFRNQPLSKKPGPMILKPVKKSWIAELWRLKTETNPFRALLKTVVPFKYLEKIDIAMNISGEKAFFAPIHAYGYTAAHPAIWYRRYWPKMRFFAFPSYSEGHVRINVKGREGQGVVEPKDYGKVCDEVEGFLGQLRSGRTGKPMLKKVLRVRKDPFELGPGLPDEDLLIHWEPEVADVADHPEVGRVGPVPYARPGGHIWLGFYLAAGPGIEPKARGLEDSIHLTSTFLHHMGCPVPDYMDAKKVLF